MLKRLLIFAVAMAAATVAAAQTYKPAIEYQSLMNLRYYEGQGGFLVEDLQVVFPPANIGNAKLVVTEQGGAVVDTLPLRYEAMEFPAFGRFRPESGNPGNVRVGRTGSFVSRWSSMDTQLRRCHSRCAKTRTAIPSIPARSLNAAGRSRTIKTYKTTVSGGQIQRLPRNSLNFEPHAEFISPRFIDTSSGSNSRYKMYEMYWLKKQ